METILKWQRQTRNGGQYDRPMGKDHREDKAQEDRVQHRVIARPGAEILRQAEPQNGADGEPKVTGDQIDRHVARQAGLF